MKKNCQAGNKKFCNQKIKKTSLFPRPVITLFCPKNDASLHNITPESLDVDEIQALHLLITKATNMTEEEMEIKKTIEAHRLVPNDTFCVILTENEAVKILYGAKAKESWQFDTIRKGFKKLCQKKRKVYLPVPEKEGKFVITTLTFLEEKKELILSSKNGNKKYRAFYIPKAIVFLHKKYGYFKTPTLMFDYLRKIPPNAKMTRELAIISYNIFSEVRYKQNDENIILRKKQKFITNLAKESIKDNRHLGRLTKNIENIYFQKLINLKIIKNWEIYKGPDGDVYKITIAPKKEIKHLFS